MKIIKTNTKTSYERNLPINLQDGIVTVHRKHG